MATITLNRPDKLNAWTAVMEQEVRAAMAEAERDENVRVIVLTGAGRGFCAGADMSLLSTVATKGLDAAQRAQAVQAGAGSGSGSGNGSVRADFQKKYSYFPAMSKPVIAAINGPAVGLGLVIALYCDLRFASDAARFSTAFARRGLIAEYGMAWMLPRLVGHANALDLLFSARLIDAAEAFRMGLANQVYPAGRVSGESAGLRGGAGCECEPAFIARDQAASVRRDVPAARGSVRNRRAGNAGEFAV